VRLADLRRVAVRNQVRVRFVCRNEVECVINEHGIAQISGIASAPGFNIERELESAKDFVMEQVSGQGRPQSLRRDELERMAALRENATAPAHDPDD
jgi:hypothetical protein